MKLSRAQCRICILVLMATIVITTPFVFAGNPDDDPSPPYSEGPGTLSGSSAGASSTAPQMPGNLTPNESLPSQIPADQRDRILAAIERKLTGAQFDASHPVTEKPREKLGELDPSDSPRSSATSSDSDNNDTVIFKEAVQEIAHVWIRAGEIAIDILALNERLQLLRPFITRQKDYQPIQDSHIPIIQSKLLNLISEFSLSNSQLTGLLLRCRTIECAIEIAQVQTQLIKYGRFVNKRKHPFDEKPIHPLILKSLDLVQQTFNFTPATPRSQYQMAFNKVIELFRLDLDAVTDSSSDQSVAPSNLTDRLSRAAGTPLSAILLPHISENIIKEQLQFTEDLKTQVLSRISQSSAASLRPSFGSSSVSPLISDGKLRTTPELPDNPIYKTVQLRLREAQDSHRAYTDVKFAGFSDIFMNNTSNTDQGIYTEAVEEFGSIFIQATQTIIEILAETGQVVELKTGSTKDLDDRAQVFQAVGSKFLKLFQRLSLSEDRVIALMQKCTTSECVLDLALAQSQLIEYGRSINKEKHKFDVAQIHPLILRALEEVYYQNAIAKTPQTPYQIVFNHVVDIFRSDFALLTATRIPGKVMNSSPLKSWLNQENPFGMKHLPHVSDPEIVAQLRYIEKVKHDVLLHVNTGTDLHKFGKTPRYFTHTLHCKNRSEQGGVHIFLWGIHDFECHSGPTSETLYMNFMGIGPGAGIFGETLGTVYIQSPSPITPRGLWLGIHAGLSFIGGGHAISAIGKNGSVLEGFFFNYGGSAFTALSRILIY